MSSAATASSTSSGAGAVVALFLLPLLPPASPLRPTHRQRDVIVVGVELQILIAHHRLVQEEGGSASIAHWSKYYCAMLLNGVFFNIGYIGCYELFERTIDLTPRSRWFAIFVFVTSCMTLVSAKMRRRRIICYRRNRYLRYRKYMSTYFKKESRTEKLGSKVTYEANSTCRVLKLQIFYA